MIWKHGLKSEWAIQIRTSAHRQSHENQRDSASCCASDTDTKQTRYLDSWWSLFKQTGVLRSGPWGGRTWTQIVWKLTFNTKIGCSTNNKFVEQTRKCVTKTRIPTKINLDWLFALRIARGRLGAGGGTRKGPRMDLKSYQELTWNGPKYGSRNWPRNLLRVSSESDLKSCRYDSRIGPEMDPRRDPKWNREWTWKLPEININFT